VRIVAHTWWLTLASSQTHTQQFAHFPFTSLGHGERAGRAKVRKLLSQDKDNLIGEAKA